MESGEYVFCELCLMAERIGDLLTSQEETKDDNRDNLKGSYANEKI